jgi:hypothetical protein
MLEDPREELRVAGTDFQGDSVGEDDEAMWMAGRDHGSLQAGYRVGKYPLPPGKNVQSLQSKDFRFVLTF